MTRVRGAGGRAAEVGAWVDRWVAAAQARTPDARALAAMAALQGARPGAARAGFCAELRRALQRRWVDLCRCSARTLGMVVISRVCLHAWRTIGLSRTQWSRREGRATGCLPWCAAQRRGSLAGPRTVSP